MNTQEQAAFDLMREALKQALYVLQIPIVSCQKGVIENCKCRHCVIERGDEALSAAKAVSEVGINGLTEAETNASMSVMGLSKKAVQPQAQREK